MPTTIERLYRLKELYNKVELTDEEKDEIAEINYDLDVVNETLCDEKLCKEMLSFLNETGTTCNNLLFSVVGLAQYAIECNSPNDCGYDVFDDW